MAHMTQEMKKELAPAIKEICKKYGIKASIGVQNYSTLVLNINSGTIDFGTDYEQVNQFHFDSHHEGDACAFLAEVIPAMMKGNHNNSDVMTDYFDVGWYISVNIGRWDKAYKLIK